MNPIQQIEARAEAIGVPISHILYSAGVNFSTWWRWKRGKFQPRQAKLQAVLDVLSVLESAPNP